MQQPTENLHDDTDAYKNAIVPTVLNVIESGLDLERVDQNNKTSLIFACKNRMEQVALALIKTGEANLGQVDKDGKTAFMYACEGNMPDVCLALIKTREANLGQVDKDGKMAFMYACEGNMPDVCLALIKTGEANLGQVDKDGKTALMYAYKGNMADVCLALIKIKTKIDGCETPHDCIDTECSTNNTKDNNALVKASSDKVKTPNYKEASPTKLEEPLIPEPKTYPLLLTQWYDRDNCVWYTIRSSPNGSHSLVFADFCRC